MAEDSTVPFPDAEVAPAVADPHEIADEFLAAAQEAGAESGNKIESTVKRRRRTTATTASADGGEVLDDSVKWTPDGIGTAAVFAANFGFMAADMVPLEPEEEKKVRVVVPMYLNYRAPKAAKIQPEVMIVALLAELLGPRLAAKRAAAAGAQPQGLERTA